MPTNQANRIRHFYPEIRDLTYLLGTSNSNAPRELNSTVLFHIILSHLSIPMK